MKSKCEFCGKEMSRLAQSSLASYSVGKLSCPHCHKQNKRYISALDLEMYTLGLMIIYGIAALVPLLLSIIPIPESYYIYVMLVLMLLVVILIFKGTGQWARYVYNQAPLKKLWANYTMKEDAAKVSKQQNTYFILFIVVVFALGIAAVYFYMAWIYVVGLLIYLVVFLLQVRRTYQIEKTYYETTFARNK